MMAAWELPGARLTEDLKSGETAAGSTDGLHGMNWRTRDAPASLPPSSRRYRRPNTAAAFFGLRHLRPAARLQDSAAAAAAFYSGQTPRRGGSSSEGGPIVH